MRSREQVIVEFSVKAADLDEAMKLVRERHPDRKPVLTVIPVLPS